MKKRSHKEGFTLVEVLVVCMIIAIVGAMTIPSFSGYIKSQKEKAAIKECHVVVAAAQSYYTELYTKNRLPQNVSQRTDAKTAIMKMADTNGEVRGDINYEWKVNEAAKSGDSTTTRQKVIWLAYKAENGLHVVYNADRSGEKYYLSDETWTDTDATTESTTAAPTTATNSSTEASSATTETPAMGKTIEEVLKWIFDTDGHWQTKSFTSNNKSYTFSFILLSMNEKNYYIVQTSDTGKVKDYIGELEASYGHSDFDKEQQIIENDGNNNYFTGEDAKYFFSTFVSKALGSDVEIKKVFFDNNGNYSSYND